MDGTKDRVDALLRSGARRLTGYQRRLFQAEVASELCGGSPRLALRWGVGVDRRHTINTHDDRRCD